MSAPRFELPFHVVGEVVGLIFNMGPKRREILGSGGTQALADGGGNAVEARGRLEETVQHVEGFPIVSIGEGLEVPFSLRFEPPGSDGHELVVKPHGARTEEREPSEGHDPHEGVFWIADDGDPAQVLRAVALGEEARKDALDETMLEVQVDARAVHAVEGLEDDRLRALAPPLPFRFGSAARGPERVEGRLPGVRHLGKRRLQRR
jgi:hypothetical protein